MPAEHAAQLAALLCATLVTTTEPATIPLLRRLAAIDTPNERSSHVLPTPRGGGAPVAAGIVLATALLAGGTGVIMAMTVGGFAAIGFTDDLTGLPALRRLALQGMASLAAGTVLAARSGLALPLAIVTALAIAAWLTAFVNSFNFMDGVNGISGAHALVGGGWFCYLGWQHSDRFLAAAGAAVAAGGLAFLPWNALRARVFLGDVGSYALGAALALLAAVAVLHGLPPEVALSPLAVYLTDTGSTLLRRIRAGERWLEPHRTHVYQRLCDTGWSHQQVSLAAGGLTAALCLLGAASLTGHLALRVGADLAGLGLLAGYLRTPALLSRRTLAEVTA